MDTTRTRRAALYLRQSQYHDGSISEELQETTTRALCEREGWEVVGVYKDIDLSGTSTTKRTGLKALRSSYDRGEFDIAVAHAVSRFSRNMQDGAEIVAEMPIATVLEGEAPHDDDFMPLLHMLLAHKQSKEIGKRWKEVHAHRIARGLPPTGGPRFGYVVNEDGTYSPDIATAPVLREMYSRFINGSGTPAITSWLNEAGHRTTKGNAWSEYNVRDVLNSGFGAGRIEFKGSEFWGVHEPVISRDVWEMFLRAKAARAAKPRKAQAARWHLQGLVRCGLCGSTMVINGGTEFNKKLACSKRLKQGKSECAGVFTRKNWIDNKIALWLGGHIQEWADATPQDTEKRAKAEGRAARALDALEGAEKALGRLAEGWATGMLDDAGYRHARASVEAQRDEARRERAEALSEVDSLLPADADPFDVIEAGGDLDTGQWNAVLAKIINRIEAHPDNRLRVVDSHGTEKWLSK